MVVKWCYGDQVGELQGGGAEQLKAMLLMATKWAMKTVRGMEEEDMMV